MHIEFKNHQTPNIKNCVFLNYHSSLSAYTFSETSHLHFVSFLLIYLHIIKGYVYIPFFLKHKSEQNSIINCCALITQLYKSYTNDLQ